MAKQQIFELRSTMPIRGANFAINDRSCVRQRSRDLLSNLREGSERIELREISWQRPDLNRARAR